MHPGRHPEAAKRRRDYVLDRLKDEGWADADAVARAKRSSVAYRPQRPARVPARATLAWLGEIHSEEAPDRADEGRGAVAWTTLDPWLQAHAEAAVASGLTRLKKRRSLAKAPVGIALVALDVETGAVLAHVGGDPSSGGLDRARKAMRQPGSTVKPFVMLEALADCGARDPLTLATRIADAPVTVDLPDGPWIPRNPDGRYRGPLTLRRALAESRNVPTVRVTAACGFDAVASRLRSVGLDLPDPPPPSFALGAVETTPLRLAAAYTALAGEGLRREPYAWTMLTKPGGRRLDRRRPGRDRVVDAAPAWLIGEALREAVRDGTGRAAQLDGLEVAAKTGTTNDKRDAWLAGWAGSVVTVVWVGRDDGQPLGLDGSSAAAPIWRKFMDVAARVRPPRDAERPERRLTRSWIDPERGWSLKGSRPGAREEWFLRGTVPPRKRWWKRPRIEVLEIDRIEVAK